VDQVLGPSGAEARAIAFHPNGSILIVGFLTDSSGQRWIVRRSTNSGGSWSPVDSYQAKAGYPARAEAIAIASSGAVYVAGMVQGFQKGNYTLLWTVRRSTDGGATWSLVDSFTLASSRRPSVLAGPTGVAVTPSGQIYVCGYTETDAPTQWLVRKGTPGINGSISWATVDNFQLAAGQSARPNAVTRDAFGNIYVAGQANDAAGAGHWIVRKLAP
jgi:hypothetical protein